MQTKLSVETFIIFHHSSFKGGGEEKLSDPVNPYIHVVHVHYIYSESININTVC